MCALAVKAVSRATPVGSAHEDAEFKALKAAA
jgi:hypothetical protein